MSKALYAFNERQVFSRESGSGTGPYISPSVSSRHYTLLSL